MVLHHQPPSEINLIQVSKIPMHLKDLDLERRVYHSDASDTSRRKANDQLLFRYIGYECEASLLRLKVPSVSSNLR